MKKLLTLAIVVVLTLGLAAATYAVELKASGFIWHFTGLTVNNALQDPGPPPQYPSPDNVVTNADTGWDDIGAAAATWARLQFTMEASEDLRGVLHFEMGGPGAGNWGGPDIGQWYADFIGFEVKQAYVDFKIPGTDAFPTRATVGIQPWVFSPQLVSDEDGPGVTLSTTVGPAAIKLMWAKLYEGNTFRSDDLDRYGASVSFPAGPVTPSIWSSYYVIGDNTGGAFPRGAFGGESGWAWYTAVNARGKAGPVAFWADFVYETAEIDYSIPVPGLGWYGQPVIWDGEDYSGWIVRANASIPFGMVTVGGEFMYGSGGDEADWANDSEWTGWLPPPGFDGLFGNAGLVYYKSYYSILAGITTGAGSDWYAKGFATVKPLDWMTVTLQGMYIGDNVKNGDMYGDAIDFLGLPEDNSDAGIEVDMFVDIPIYDNLMFQIGAGYLFAGSALDRYVPGSITAYGIPLNESPANPWAAITKLSFNF